MKKACSTLKTKRHLFILINLILFSSGVMLFAWFVHDTTYARMIAFAALSLPCLALYRHTLKAPRPMDLFKELNPPHFWGSLFSGILLGVGVALYYRVSIGTTALPAFLTLFAPVAMCIGIAEEFVFRGAAFYLLRKWQAYFIIPVTALLHASYKTLLFLQPNTLHPVDTVFLFSATMLGGIVIGFLRHMGGSVFPAMAAHGIWDLIVYGDNTHAPWWVW